jgi:predicted transcriptional regulator
MARVALLCSDLLFASRVEEPLRAAGHEVVGSVEGADVVIADLSVGVDLPHGVKTIGFYPHVDVEARRRGEAAGFDLVVPRSRMAREAARLVEGLDDS